MYPSPKPHPQVVPVMADRADAIRHIKAEHYERVLVGGIALLAPTLLIVTDLLTVPGSPTERGSLSAYFYSALRDLFVGITCALGALLIAHRIGERNLDDRLGTLAGIAGIVLALFPTSRPPHEHHHSLVAVQRAFGEGPVSDVHTAAAAVMLAALFALTMSYAVRQGRLPRTGRRSPRFWRAYHLGCAGLMLASAVYTLLSNGLGLVGPASSLLYSESMAIGGFALSWLALGLNPRALRLPSPASVDEHVPFEDRHRASGE